jgi:hypothetical protein
MVVLNKNAEAVPLPLDRFAERLQGFRAARDVITGAEMSLGDRLELPARSVQVLELD